jgi:hypothetical protein
VPAHEVMFLWVEDGYLNGCLIFEDSDVDAPDEGP